MNQLKPWRRVVGVFFTIIGLLACSDSDSPKPDDVEHEDASPEPNLSGEAGIDPNDAGTNTKSDAGSNTRGDAGTSTKNDAGANIKSDSGVNTRDDAGQGEQVLEPERTKIGKAIGAPARATIGIEGGALASPDGVMTIDIPAGALAKDTVIEIQPITNLAPGGVGDGYELAPESTQFALPVTLRFKYTKASIAGSAAPFLGIAVQNADRYWELQWASTKLDKAASTVSVQTTHFSRWSAVTSVYLEPTFSSVMTKASAAFYVSMCSQLPSKEPGDTEPVFLTRCSKMSTSLAAEILSNWAVDGKSGGDSKVGTVRSDIENAYYTAPAKKPSPATVTLSVDGRNFYKNDQLVTLTAEVDIIDEDRPYIGYMTFTYSPGESLAITGDADITWVPVEDLGDTRRYRPTGTVKVVVTASGCDPGSANFTYPESGAGQLVIFTSSNSAYKNQYHFAATVSGEVTLVCGRRPRTRSQLTVQVFAMGGACDTLPPYAPLTNENHLQGSGPCALGMLSDSEWSFVRDQSDD